MLFANARSAMTGVITLVVHNIVLSWGVGQPNWWSGSYDGTTFPINTCHRASLTSLKAEPTKGVTRSAGEKEQEVRFQKKNEWGGTFTLNCVCMGGNKSNSACRGHHYCVCKRVWSGGPHASRSRGWLALSCTLTCLTSLSLWPLCAGRAACFCMLSHVPVFVWGCVGVGFVLKCCLGRGRPALILTFHPPR